MSQNRPPIVVILGHVDHGKTSLLDYLRSSNIAAREAGGITQHIRSFQLNSDSSKPITFIDTPGHAAFAAMRSRGSKIADFAILVVAGNDGVMPQTKQSIQFIKEANIPFIVAINKSDLSTFEPDRVKTQLTESEIVVEDYGGDVPAVNISAKTGAGIPDLLEIIGLMSELHPPVADPAGSIEAVVLESRLDPQKGPLAVVIVKSGTLTIGTPLFQSEELGKIKALVGSDGVQLKAAGPSTPVEIIGLKSVPEVGSSLYSTLQTKKAATSSVNKSSMDAEVKIILKTDVAGSLEAILNSLPKEVSVLSSGTGEVTDSDVDLAKTSSAVIVTFNAKVSSNVSKLAEIEKVSIRSYKIIYELLDSVQKLISPQIIEEVIGKATIAAEFKMNGDRIAGCRCTEGTISKGDQVKIMRQDTVVGITRVKNLQSGKLAVEKMKSGSEFGVVFHPYVDFKLQDSIIVFKTHVAS